MSKGSVHACTQTKYIESEKSLITSPMSPHSLAVHRHHIRHFVPAVLERLHRGRRDHEQRDRSGNVPRHDSCDEAMLV